MIRSVVVQFNFRIIPSGNIVMIVGLNIQKSSENPSCIEGNIHGLHVVYTKSLKWLHGPVAEAVIDHVAIHWASYTIG